MGQLSAYRFPESNGWEKVWSWTSDSEITASYTKILIPYEKFNKDLYFITFGGFKSKNKIVDSQSSIYLGFSLHDKLLYDSVNDLYFAHSTFYYAEASANILPFIFSIGAEKDNRVSYWRSDGGSSPFSVNNGNHPQSDYHYLMIWLLTAQLLPGATIDFYGMNLPK